MPARPKDVNLFRAALAVLFVDAPFLTLLSAALLLIILGQLDLDLGLFHVVWWPSGTDTTQQYDVLLNGVGAGLMFSTFAYLGYLLRARRDAAVVDRRLGLCAVLVAPFVLAAMLPAVSPSTFTTLPTDAVASTVRFWFVGGLVIGVVGFWGLVVAVSVTSPDQQFDLYLEEGAKAVVLTFTKPAVLAHVGGVRVLDRTWKAVPVKDVVEISRTQFRVNFASELPASGLYQFTVGSSLPTAALPAAVTQSFREGQKTCDVTFPTPPLCFGREDIAGVFPEDGSGRREVASVRPDADAPGVYQIELTDAPPPGRCYIAFTSNLPGVEGNASVSPELAAGTTEYVLSFASAPGYDLADVGMWVAGVTDGNGRPVDHPTTAVEVSPTQYQLTFGPLPAGRLVIALRGNPADARPTTHAPGMPEEHDADPPVWLQANGLFALALLFFFFPVGYSIVDPFRATSWRDIPWPAFPITLGLILLSLAILVFATPRRVWSAVASLGGFAPDKRPQWVQEWPEGVRRLGVLGFLLITGVVGYGAWYNLFPNDPTPVAVGVFAAYLGFVAIGVWWLLTRRAAATVIRHGATTVLVSALGVLIGATLSAASLLPLAARVPVSVALVGVVVLTFLSALRRSRADTALLPGQRRWFRQTCLVCTVVVLCSLAVLAVNTAGKKIPAALSLSLLFVLLGIGYGALHFYAKRRFYPMLGLALAFVAFVAGTRPYPHQLAALGPYYRLKDTTDAKSSENMFVTGPPTAKPDLEKYHQFVERYSGAPRVVDGKPNLRLQLDDDEMLAAWRDRLVANPKRAVDRAGKRETGAAARPPLVIVTTAGGASTSAIYTYAVLRGLEKEFPGFHRHVRLVTGASGGMLGAAFYRAVLGEFYADPENAKTLDTDPAKFDELLHARLVEREKQLNENFLSPIVQALVFKDVPQYLWCPFGYADDRGSRLESAWGRGLGGSLDKSFDALRAEEREHLLPSLVFTPMMIEDGRPMVISTLDLDYMTRTPAQTDKLRPYRSLEFFKLFPETGWDMRLSTAVRLNASFPWLSPGVALPTLPPRRLVDAGYYDNYGLDAALGWLGRGWDGGAKPLAQYADRVLLVNIRPYMIDDVMASAVSEGDLDFRYGTRPPSDNRKRTDDPPYRLRSTLADPLAPFSGPPAGGNAARKTGMIARNANLLSVLQHIPTVSPAALFGQALNRVSPVKSAEWVNLPPMTVVTFRGNSRASLNWTLPVWEQDELRKSAKNLIENAEMRGEIRNALIR